MRESLTTDRINSVQEFVRTENLLKSLEQMKGWIKYLDKSLTEYLDNKRAEFARLYFTSNDELIQLMGNLKNTAYL